VKITARFVLVCSIATIVVTGIVIGNIDRPPVHRPLTSAVPSLAPPLPPLALLSSRGGASSSAYYKVEGEVQNIGTTPLRSIVAVATWYDKQDSFISADSGLVEYDPLMPGQKSPYSVLIRANPLMHQYTVGFKQIGGGELTVEDRRKKKQ
jgi:hypothetical protein